MPHGLTQIVHLNSCDIYNKTHAIHIGDYFPKFFEYFSFAIIIVGIRASSFFFNAKKNKFVLMIEYFVGLSKSSRIVAWSRMLQALWIFTYDCWIFGKWISTPCADTNKRETSFSLTQRHDYAAVLAHVLCKHFQDFNSYASTVHKVCMAEWSDWMYVNV